MSDFVSPDPEATTDWIIGQRKPVQSAPGSLLPNLNRVPPTIQASYAFPTIDAKGGTGTEHNDVLTLMEAAMLMRIHPVTLRKKAVAWGVPHKRLGSEWRFSRMVLTAWMQERDAA